MRRTVENRPRGNVGSRFLLHSHKVPVARVVQRGGKVAVIGNVHTNTIEDFWSLLKREISGVYHSVSEKHLKRYLNEYAFRYNNRDDGTPLYETMRERAKRVRAGQHGKYAPIG